MTQQHTKGPWHYEISENAPDNYEVRNNLIEVAQVDRLLDVSPMDENGGSEGEANARLIAAAPTMKNMLGWLVLANEQGGIDKDQIIEEAKALLKQINGEA